MREEVPVRILVPLDGSALSERSVEVAVRLARAMEGEIVLFAVADPAETSGHADQIREDHESQFERVAARCAGVPTQQRIDTRGEAAGGILDAVRELEVDHIVMTTHGRSGLSRLAQGSVAEEVLRNATVPITLVRPTDEDS
jgi:nucleotide-binding universal stress UspA family protein